MWKIPREKESKTASYERFTQGWSGEGPTVLSTAVSNDAVGS
jgi:hypothetical protein